MAVEEYKTMASYYDIIIEPLLWKMRKKIVKMCRLSTDTSVLEVACGTGAQGKRLAGAGAHYKGIDLSEDMLLVASKRKLDCIHGDGTDLPFKDGSFDISTISLALHEVDERIRSGILKEMIRVTKDGGAIIIADYIEGENRSFYTPAGRKIIHYVEKLVGGDHYRNYLKFMSGGGLIPFLKSSGLYVSEKVEMFGGNMGIVRLEKIHASRERTNE